MSRELASGVYLCKRFRYDKKRRINPVYDTHNADSVIESKVIYYLEQCGLRV